MRHVNIFTIHSLLTIIIVNGNFIKYTQKPAGTIEHLVSYVKYSYRNLGVPRDFSMQFLCNVICAKYEDCKSFHVDGTYCVFGVTRIISELQNGEEILPPSNDLLLWTKSKTFLYLFEAKAA